MKPYDAYPIISEDLAEVDRVIKERLDSPVALIRTIATYIINAGGKRLRPVLLTLFARALGYGQTEQQRAQGHHWLMAAVVEFIHTATLLHDDIVDESTLRRGAPTANAQFGNAASVLVGDFLYSRSFQMMVEVEQLHILKTLADATNVIAEGEVLQLLNCNDPDVDEAAYLQVIRFKTAKLFEASARIGAVLAGATPELEDAAAAYGRHLGTAFQIIDDVLDYSKATLPLIRVMEVGSPEDREIVRQAILNGETEHFDLIHQAIQRCDALGYARQLAEQEANRAHAALAQMPPSQYREALVYLSSYSVSRNM